LTRAHAAVATARIRRAEAADAAGLTSLAQRSKAFWGYDAAFMAACRFELTLEGRDIADDPTFVIEAQGEILGFYQLRLQGSGGDIRMFFIAPEAVRSGLGRRLWAHLERTARALGATRLEVDSDPHAEGFYRAMGMRRTGQAASGSIAGRMLPHLVKVLDPAPSNAATVARAALNDP
jgi:ribosomal protein S18 acetylase RimI-like enzyme